MMMRLEAVVSHAHSSGLLEDFVPDILEVDAGDPELVPFRLDVSF